MGWSVFVIVCCDHFYCALLVSGQEAFTHHNKKDGRFLGYTKMLIFCMMLSFCRIVFSFFVGCIGSLFFFGPLFICRGSEHSYWKCHAKAKMWSFNFEADIYLVKSKSKATKWRRKLPKRERKKCARWMKMCTVVILAQFQCQASAWNCLVRFFCVLFTRKPIPCIYSISMRNIN